MKAVTTIRIAAPVDESQEQALRELCNSTALKKAAEDRVTEICKELFSDADEIHTTLTIEEESQ